MITVLDEARAPAGCRPARVAADGGAGQLVTAVERCGDWRRLHARLCARQRVEPPDAAG